MSLKKVAAIVVMAAFAAPSLAFDARETGASTMFYVSIPLDYRASKKEQRWSAGLQLQGKRDYQAVQLDSSMFNFLPAGGLEAKWIVAGVVAVGGAVALGSKSKSTTQQLQAQQTQHQQQIAADCPTPTTNPCIR